ncbi:hypothetical protein B0H10DRAFT_1958561 [Mycena sp. CBHHK59/15]|nr:hypothetical protein B0H10DRAFT_1958561 [Mycena sp. CBHHK59/15]
MRRYRGRQTGRGYRRLAALFLANVVLTVHVHPHSECEDINGLVLLDICHYSGEVGKVTGIQLLQMWRVDGLTTPPTESKWNHESSRVTCTAVDGSFTMHLSLIVREQPEIIGYP